MLHLTQISYISQSPAQEQTTILLQLEFGSIVLSKDTSWVTFLVTMRASLHAPRFGNDNRLKK